MNIIKPSHNIPAKEVKSWSEIKEEALELREFVNHGEFDGLHENAYAISHAQVSENPKKFFVLHTDFEDLFGSWCVINHELCPKKGRPACAEPVIHKEACMSWPYRKPKNIERFNLVRVKYKVPFLWTWRTKTKQLEGLAAFISQHEAEHAAGKNIYGK